VARSLEDGLKEGDEVLTTDMEYGACDRLWELVCERKGAKYVRHLVLVNEHSTQQQLGDAIIASMTKRTRIVFLSHITSVTAMILPVAQVCAAARGNWLLWPRFAQLSEISFPQNVVF
jgi:isopenicillin-N epimerase